MKIFKNLALGVFAALASTSLIASEMEVKANIVDTAKQAGQFSTLLTALDVAGLTETLATTEDLTVFAPTDEAFAQIPSETLEGLLSDPEALKDILLYHVVAAKVPSATAITLSEAEMINGKFVNISLENEGLFINDSKVIATDIAASNGIIHVLDAVLIPSAE